MAYAQYVYQATGNNMPWDDHSDPPNYNMKYGFVNGAQRDVLSLAGKVADSLAQAVMAIP